MAGWDDVRRCVEALPEVEERLSHGTPAWYVRGAMFVWDRPLRASDLEVLGDRAPRGDVVGLRVADEGVKHALVSDRAAWCFTTPHFDGYAVVLVDLDAAPADELVELVEEAWLLRAPKKVAAAWLASRGSTDA